VNRLRLWGLAVLALGLMMGLVAHVLLRPHVQQIDRALGPLPLATLEGTPIDPGSFAGRPWVVNVWMPG
jgi:hypothetical protein